MSHNNVMFVLLIVCWLCSMGESGVIVPEKPLETHWTGGNENFQMKTNISELDCSQFSNDYDIIRQFPFPILLLVLIDEIYDEDLSKTRAVMDKNGTIVKSLYILREAMVPWSMYCLSNVETLLLEWTPFENDIVPDALANMKKLRNFWIYHSPIIKMTEQLGTMTSIWMLIFQNCSLTHLPNLSNLHQMWGLSVPNNRLSHIDGIHGVLSLGLGGNLFKQIPEIKEKEKLRSIDMSHNPLTNIVPIFSFTNLELLSLSNLSLTSIPPAIDKLQKLKIIQISNNKLSNLPPNILNLPLLSKLNINQNLISTNNIQAIQKAFKKSHPELNLII